MNSIKRRLDRIQHGGEMPVVISTYEDGLYHIDGEKLTPDEVLERYDLDAVQLVVVTWSDAGPHPLQSPDDEVRQMTFGDD